MGKNEKKEKMREREEGKEGECKSRIFPIPPFPAVPDLSFCAGLPLAP